MIAPDILMQAQTIADRLAAIPGVCAVALGGSWARGAGDSNADIDLGIYYDPSDPPALTNLRRLAAAIDDGKSGDAVTDFGGWGPWINGGAWLVVDGQRVDWIYRDVQQVAQIFDECCAGRPAMYYQPGHPHGFHTPIYMAEIAVAVPLHDPAGMIAAFKARTTPYPEALRRAIIANNLWEAKFALDTTRKSAVRGDVLHVSGGLFRCAACLIQALFALNEQYCLNEKGALAAVEHFSLRPTEFVTRVKRTLSHLGVGAAGLQVSVETFDWLVVETRGLCAEVGFDSH